MDDLVVFLRARLDADQEWADSVLADPGSDDHGIAQRWLRDVEAKRRILARHYETTDNGVACCARCTEGGGIIYWPCEDLRDLAEVYSDHPDYSTGWH